MLVLVLFIMAFAQALGAVIAQVVIYLLAFSQYLFL
jgi:hypothetical protein